MPQAIWETYLSLEPGDLRERKLKPGPGEGKKKFLIRSISFFTGYYCFPPPTRVEKLN